MSQNNFFDFNFKSLKLFLIKDLKIEEKKVSMRSKQIWQSIYKKEAVNWLTPSLAPRPFCPHTHFGPNHTLA